MIPTSTRIAQESWLLGLFPLGSHGKNKYMYKGGARISILLRWMKQVSVLLLLSKKSLFLTLFYFSSRWPLKSSIIKESIFICKPTLCNSFSLSQSGKSVWQCKIGVTMLTLSHRFLHCHTDFSKKIFDFFLA